MIFKNIKRIGLIVSISILSISSAFSQNTFRISYDVDPLYDMPGGIVESTTGNYVFGGGLLIGGITEITPAGTVNWSELYSEGTTIFSDVINNASTGFIIAGSSSNRLLLMETSATGTMLWGTKYNTSAASESASQVKRLSSGDYIISGSVSGFDPDGTGPLAKHDSSTLYIVKTNSSGTVLWDKILLPTAYDNDHYLTDVAEVSGGYIFVGSLSETGTLGDDATDAVVLKTDANGNLLWIKKMGSGGNSESFQSINTLSNGQVIISGIDGDETILVRLDANGNNTGSYSYDDSGFLTFEVTQGYSAFETNDGKYAMIGTYLDPLTFINGVNGNFPMIGSYLLKIEPSNGNIIFQKFYQNGLSALMPDGIQASDNGYLITMMAQEIAPLSGFNYHTVKTDANGDAGTSCDISNISLSRSNYTPSFTTITPSEYTGTTTSTFTPILNTPTPSIGAICCSVEDPTVATASPSTVCAGQSITVSASGSAPGVTYNIYTAASGGSLVGTAGTPFVPTQGTYYVEAASPLGCLSTGRIVVNVTITSAPTATVSGGGGYCAGGTAPVVNITFTQTGPWDVTYSDGTTSFPVTTSTNPYVITGGADGTYTVSSISNASCAGTSSGSVTITTNALPTVVGSSAPGTTICAGDQITLTGSGATSYSWTGGATNGVAFTPSATTYTVTGTDGNSCQNTDQVTISINALPTVVANSTTTNVCAGDQITLTGSGATSYTWTGGVSDNVAFTPTSTTYTVTGTDGNSCSNTDAIAITVNALPTISVAGTISICDGDNTSLTASGASTYAWSPSTGLSATTGAIVTASPSADITYTITGTDVNTCVNSTTVSVVVNSLPTVVANVSPSSTVCTGSSITLTGSGATSYTWDLGVNDGVSFIPGATDTYTVTGTDGNSCSNTDQITVTVVAPPVAAINGTTSGSVTACSNAMTTLTITPAGGTYLWSTGATTQSIDVMPTLTTNYTATVTIGSCSDGTDYTVTVNTAPTGSVSGTGNNLVCTGTNDTLTASGGATYLWITTETTPSIVVTPTTNTDYTVVVYDANNCTDTLTYSVAVNPLPTISITGIDTICSGTSTTLSGNGGIGYIWSTAETTQTITVSPTLNTSYTLTGTDGNGCQNTDQVDVVVMAPPSAAVTGDTITCTGQAVTLTAAGGNNYVWNTGETTQTISVSPGTTTSYTVVAYVGTCTDTANYIVNVTAPPNVSVGADTSIIIGQSFILNATGATEYSWISPTDGIDIDDLNLSNPTASPEETITYCVIGEQYGCVDTACINVEVVIDCGEIFVPNAFSPNGDGNNDCLKVYSNCLETMTLKIYARWGEVVFETSDIEGCWDGTFKGQELNTATFAFVLEYSLIDGTSDVLKGNVSLIK